ncbi:hypothetical protein JCM19037_3210 [Geomicrobium sp. JCM 19037]|uniref:hypothetical protein n=1 Tax=unclassified Geomicrobium TaxID=2628951 RepID=UPI00045F1F69|nr:hypothetical protein [Geomicrobium sp. JCM 19037]GAK04766.1 hypothetical protein JCM19037_3210 [Geomicrobium sp. JCM 19037]
MTLMKSIVVMIVLAMLTACSSSTLNEAVESSYEGNDFTANITHVTGVTEEENKEALTLSADSMLLYVTVEIEATDSVHIDQRFYERFEIETTVEPFPISPFIEQLQDAPDDMQIVNVQEQQLNAGEQTSIELAYNIQQGSDAYQLHVHDGPSIQFPNDKLQSNRP